VRDPLDIGGLDLPLVRGAKIDHVSVAVHDAAVAAKLFRDVLGAEFRGFGDNQEQGFRWVQYRFPEGGRLELVTSIREGSFVSKFLDRRGEGVHHMTLRVSDLPAQVERLRAAGVELLMVDLEDPSWREAFIHPKNAHGVLIQIAEPLFVHEDPDRHFRERFAQAATLGLA
jgi:methylmalonyl-CoA/ethylmalonyl-CoA epimerase